MDTNQLWFLWDRKRKELLRGSDFLPYDPFDSRADAVHAAFSLRHYEGKDVEVIGYDELANLIAYGHN